MLPVKIRCIFHLYPERFTEQYDLFSDWPNRSESRRPMECLHVDMTLDWNSACNRAGAVIHAEKQQATSSFDANGSP